MMKTEMQEETFQAFGTRKSRKPERLLFEKMRLVLKACSFILFVSEASGIATADTGVVEISIPTLRDTEGRITWHLHEDKSCQRNAQLNCETSYTNGNLLCLETEEDVSRYMSMKNEHAIGEHYVGLYATHVELGNDELWWTTCRKENMTTVKYTMTPPKVDERCYIANEQTMELELELTTCSTSFPYICEERNPKEACRMKTLLNSTGSHTILDSREACDTLCQKTPNCWASLYLLPVCVTLRNTAVNSTAEIIIKQKDCFNRNFITSKKIDSQPVTCNDGDTYRQQNCTVEIDEEDSPIPIVPVCLSRTTVANGSRTSQEIHTSVTKSTAPGNGVQSSSCSETTSITSYSAITVTQTLSVSVTATCGPQMTNNTLASEDLGQKIKEIQQDLSVDNSETGFYKRTKISAADDRLSVKIIGSVGIVLTFTPLIVMVISDVVSAICRFKN